MSRPILILGERGVGKSVTVEKYVPAWKGKDVVVQNCGAWNENLVGPMLFGSTGSAFTGDAKRDGLLKNAKGKVIFLDEVHHMPKDVQRQLLRTLQDKKHRYTVVGSSDGRELTSEGTEFIFASNKSLDEFTIGFVKKIVREMSKKPIFCFYECNLLKICGFYQGIL